MSILFPLLLLLLSRWILQSRMLTVVYYYKDVYSNLLFKLPTSVIPDLLKIATKQLSMCLHICTSTKNYL